MSNTFSRRQRSALDRAVGLWKARQKNAWDFAQAISDFINADVPATVFDATIALNGEGVRIGSGTVGDWYRVYQLMKNYRDDATPFTIFVSAVKEATKRFRLENPEADDDNAAARKTITSYALRAIQGDATKKGENGVTNLVWDGASPVARERRNDDQVTLALNRLRNLIQSSTGGRRARYIKRAQRMLQAMLTEEAVAA